MSAVGDFARRVEQDVTEAVRLLTRVHLEHASCGSHDLEPGSAALSILERLESDARALSIREETKPREPAP